MSRRGEEKLKTSDNGVKYIAHRGLSAIAPENTLPAISLAAGEKGFYGVEFDVRESRAEKKGSLLLVMHDPTTERMCGRNRKVSSIKKKDLDRYRILSGNNVEEYGELIIPTAGQVLDTIWRDSKGAIPVIELKHRLSRRGLKFLLDMIGDHNVVIISFEHKAIADALKMAKKRGVRNNIITMYLVEKLPEKKYGSIIRRMKRIGIDCISVKYRFINERMVEIFHRAGIKVSAWTLPDRKRAEKYIDMGVDYITSDKVLF